MHLTLDWRWFIKSLFGGLGMFKLHPLSLSVPKHTLILNLLLEYGL